MIGTDGRRRAYRDAVSPQVEALSSAGLGRYPADARWAQGGLIGEAPVAGADDADAIRHWMTVPPRIVVIHKFIPIVHRAFSEGDFRNSIEQQHRPDS